MPDMQRHNRSLLVTGNLRRLRRQAGVTQEQLAVASGLSRTIIQRIETGKTPGSVPTIEKLAVALGIPADEFLRPLARSPISRAKPAAGRRREAHG